VNKKVTVIGSGLSGLFTAYYLRQENFDVEIIEREARVGGMVSTEIHEYGLVETAANGILNTKALEKLCENIGSPMIPVRKQSKKRFIFRNQKPRRWPLTFLESLMLLYNYVKALIFKKRLPEAGESVSAWATRVLSVKACDWLLAPALSGIYAGDVNKMSASLLFSKYFLKLKSKSNDKPFIRGIVAPRRGLGDFAEKLRLYLETSGVKFHLKHKFSLSERVNEEPIVLAASVTDTAEILQDNYPLYAAQLRTLETLPLVSITLFSNERLLNGFGCLFPNQENFFSLGVLCNSEIFNGRVVKVGVSSETWIFGGARNKEIIELSNVELIERLKKDRARLGGVDRILDFHITRWPYALPHYTLELESLLKLKSFLDLKEKGIFFMGNYLGKLGLSGILENSKLLAMEIKSLRDVK
jgi:oxygen-dependent protoporphyrinogen oxidase